ncbi:hypothetical protein GYMLUDRAFT_255924 [Collybiopsis luxurians FD-317 M1]|nr:hypothetical protein GYMLUDRAFT_255924 [Collybiopsis luxurians FD-317 M1]
MFKSAFALFALILNSASALLVLSVCDEVNLENCLDIVENSLPVACTSLAALGQSSRVESVVTPQGVACTLFTGTACTGSSQFVNGAIDNLSVVGFTGVANSFTCQAS